MCAFGAHCHRRLADGSLVAVAALVALFLWKISNPLLMALTAAAGLIAFPLLHPAWVMVR
jgi:chromate transporter